MNVGDDKNPVKYFLLMLSFPFTSIYFFFLLIHISKLFILFFSLGSATYHLCLSFFLFIFFFSSSLVFPSYAKKKRS